MACRALMTAICIALVLSGGAAFAEATEGQATEEQKEGGKVIAEGSTVSIEYTLTLKDGTVADSNVGKDPLVYEQGTKNIIPGLQSRLEGLKAGDTKTVEVPPEESYGPVDPNAFQEVEKANIPAEALKVGTVLQARGEDGRLAAVRVHEVKEDTVVLNLNHPLAGQKLTFDVRILDVQ